MTLSEIPTTTILCKCQSCEAMKPVMVGFCGEDICVECVLEHIPGCVWCRTGEIKEGKPKRKPMDELAQRRKK